MSFAAEHDIVTEGRDQGTLVFPDAFRKYYLTASDEERARRRLAEYRLRGEAIRFATVLQDQRERDARDAARAIAPMKPAADALVLDTTGLNIDQVVDRLASSRRLALIIPRHSTRWASGPGTASARHVMTSKR